MSNHTSDQDQYSSSTDPTSASPDMVVGTRLHDLTLRNRIPSTPVSINPDDDVFQDSDGTTFHRLRLQTGPMRNVTARDLRDHGSPERYAGVGPSRDTLQDAQTQYPSTACIFVASLAQSRSDSDLEAAVTRAFSDFGTVFVKIRRDGKNMPFAFCQFTRDSDAEAALREGRGRPVLGRPCRTERVKAANTVFYVFRRDGQDMTVAETRRIMEPHGKITSIEPLQEQLQSMFEIDSRAMMVRFTYWDVRRDIRSAFVNHPIYAVQPIVPVAIDNGAKADSRQRELTANQQFLRQYELDRRTVFISPLPNNMTEDEIMRMFRSCGLITGIRVRQIMNNGAPVGKSYCLITFESATSPDAAISRYNGTRAPGDVGFLKVERKHNDRRTREEPVRHNITHSAPRIGNGFSMRHGVESTGNQNALVLATPTHASSGRLQNATPGLDSTARAQPSSEPSNTRPRSATQSRKPTTLSTMQLSNQPQPEQEMQPTDRPLAAEHRVSHSNIPGTNVAMQHQMPPPPMPFQAPPTYFGYPPAMMQPSTAPMTPHGAMYMGMYGYQPTPALTPYTFHTPMWDPNVLYAAYTSPAYMAGTVPSNEEQLRPAKSEPPQVSLKSSADGQGKVDAMGNTSEESSEGAVINTDEGAKVVKK